VWASSKFLVTSFFTLYTNSVSACETLRAKVILDLVGVSGFVSGCSTRTNSSCSNDKTSLDFFLLDAFYSDNPVPSYTFLMILPFFIFSPEICFASNPRWHRLHDDQTFRGTQSMGFSWHWWKFFHALWATAINCTVAGFWDCENFSVDSFHGHVSLKTVFYGGVRVRLEYPVQSRNHWNRTVLLVPV